MNQPSSVRTALGGRIKHSWLRQQRAAVARRGGVATKCNRSEAELLTGHLYYTRFATTALQGRATRSECRVVGMARHVISLSLLGSAPAGNKTNTATPSLAMHQGAVGSSGSAQARAAQPEMAEFATWDISSDEADSSEEEGRHTVGASIDVQTGTSMTTSTTMCHLRRIARDSLPSLLCQTMRNPSESRSYRFASSQTSTRCHMMRLRAMRCSQRRSTMRVAQYTNTPWASKMTRCSVTMPARNQHSN